MERLFVGLKPLKPMLSPKDKNNRRPFDSLRSLWMTLHEMWLAGCLWTVLLKGLRS
jgi:hypothetical protein